MAVHPLARPQAAADADVLWQPPPGVRETSRMGRYMTWLEQTRGLAFESYGDLWEWSVRDLEGFWSSIWDYFEVRSRTPFQRVLGSATMPGAQWFPGATLNYAEHALRTTGDRVAVISVSQTRQTVELTADQLRDQVARARAGLVRLGVRRGDRVAAYLPNVAEAVVAYLATASLGAIWSACSPEFGARAVVDRFKQIEPVLLLTMDGYCDGGTAVDRAGEVSEIRAALPSLRATVVLPYLLDDPARVPGATAWAGLVATPAELSFEPVPFDHPLHILYSSGTTGLPKPIVHGHGGILLELLKALGLHHDLGEGDRLFWFSSTGWMMWNFMVGALAAGASIVCFDGNPAHPDFNVLWRLAEEAGVTYFGAGAAFFTACQRERISPGARFNLSRLKGVGSTASPLPAQTFRWIRDAVGPVHIASMSGGTDVCTAFVGGSPLVPVRAGEISCRSLGARVEAHDTGGRSVVGAPGELVLTAPMPSMPVGLWGDVDGSRLQEAYFSRYPGVWAHGDWITLLESGSCVISGRSDATLNRGGIRAGTAEVYAVVESLPEVADSLIVHLEGSVEGDPGELRLFVVTAPGAELDDALCLRINDHIRRELSAAHVPDRIDAVPVIPRTATGKKLEVPVKRLLQGVSLGSVVRQGSAADPEALEAFVFLARAAQGVDAPATSDVGLASSTTAETMARIWARVLGLDRVAPADDFFALGGTSLRAINMLSVIERELGVRLPVSAFLTGDATVVGMAALVDRYAGVQAPDKQVVWIRSGGDGPVVFFVHPNEGAMLTMRHFAGALRGDVGVIGLIPEHLILPGRRIQDVASSMLAAIRTIQPRGPYYLAGFSFGGLVAYEVATQLRAAADDVAWLAILDTVTVAGTRRGEAASVRLRRLGRRGLHDGVGRVRRFARRELRSVGLRLKLSRFALDHLELVVRSRQIANDVPMHLFVTADRVTYSGSRSLGWDLVHKGPLQVYEASGDHVSVLTEPYVRTLLAAVTDTFPPARTHGVINQVGVPPPASP